MKFVIASSNKGKIAEFGQILEEFGIELISKKDAGVTYDPEENGTTFEENAHIKAKEICACTGMPAIADDSGLAVDCLNGAPGVYSARYAGEDATDEERVEKLLDEIKQYKGKDERGAEFVSAISCVFPNGDEITARGVCRGYIGTHPLGENGFGYDPVFCVEQMDNKSFSQMSAEEKNLISHRGKALKEFAEKLKEYKEYNDAKR